MFQHIHARVDPSVISARTLHFPVGGAMSLTKAIYQLDHAYFKDGAWLNKPCGSMSCRARLREKEKALEHCPREILVLDVMPCDTTRRRLTLANASATKFDKALKQVEQQMNAMKKGVRNEFAPRLPASALLDVDTMHMHTQTPAWALTIHCAPTQSRELNTTLHATLSEFRQTPWEPVNVPRTALNSSRRLPSFCPRVID
jgi:hypothetical protein